MVFEPGRAQSQESRRGDLAFRSSKREAHAVEVGDRPSELLALLRVRARDGDGGSRDSHRLRGDSDASAVERGQREREALPHLTDHSVSADAHAIEHEGAGVGGLEPELAFGRTDHDARGVEWNGERRDARVRSRGIGFTHTREYDRQGRVAGVGDELLAPVEPPGIRFADRGGPQRRGIASEDGSVRAKAASPLPSMSLGSQRRRCSAVP